MITILIYYARLQSDLWRYPYNSEQQSPIQLQIKNQLLSCKYKLAPSAPGGARQLKKLFSLSDMINFAMDRIVASADIIFND